MMVTCGGTPTEAVVPWGGLLKLEWGSYGCAVDVKKSILSANVFRKSFGCAGTLCRSLCEVRVPLEVFGIRGKNKIFFTKNHFFD